MREISEMMRAARSITLRSRRAIHGPHIGTFRTPWSGSGLEFRQLREYADGDDVRAIDWSSSARTGELLVRDYYEEHNRTFVILLDCSASMGFASSEQLKSQVAAKIAGACAFSAYLSGDTVGYMSFADTRLSWMPAKRGHAHVYRIMQQAWSDAHRTSGSMSIADMLEQVMQRYRKPVGLICVSDFLHDDYQRALRNATYLHNLMPIRVLDSQERGLAVPSDTYLYDPETRERMIATGDVQDLYRGWFAHFDAYFNRIMQRYQVSTCTCYTHDDWMSQMCSV